MYDINYIIKLLNIQDKNITIVKFVFINNTYMIFADQIRDFSTVCSKCCDNALTKNSDNIRTIKHININGYASIIIFKQIYYKQLIFSFFQYFTVN